MSEVLLAAGDFVRQHIRIRITLVMLVVIPIAFVLMAANALGELSDALGGNAEGPSATALGAGWAAAFLGGVLGFFQVSASRDADRRLALAGMGPLRVAAARIGACIALAMLVAVVAFVTLWIDRGIEQPWRALIAILYCGIIYVGIGALVGSLIADELAGSLTVALIFIMDIYSGPGMAGTGEAATATPIRRSSEILMAAGGGTAPPGDDWLIASFTVVGALVVAFAAFWFSARPRS